MSGILDLLNSDLGKTIINGVAGQTNQPQNKTSCVLFCGCFVWLDTPLIMVFPKSLLSKSKIPDIIYFIKSL